MKQSSRKVVLQSSRSVGVKSKPRAVKQAQAAALIAPIRAVAESEEKQHEEDFEQLVLSHRENGRKLARSILRRWRVRMPGEEIDSVVDLSLCETAKRYSANRGATFMTFFFYHLRGHLVRTVARAAQGNNVFLAFAKNAGVETGDLTHLSTEVLYSYVPDYLLFQHRDGETPENLLIRQERIDQCRSACNKLDALEREVIDRSFGSEEALVDVAKSLGYSRCHISRVKRSALARLKSSLANVVIEAPPLEAERVQVPRAIVGRNARPERNTLRRNRRRSIHGSGRLHPASISGFRAA